MLYDELLHLSIFQDTCLSHPFWYTGVKFENLGRKKKKKKMKRSYFLSLGRFAGL